MAATSQPLRVYCVGPGALKNAPGSPFVLSSTEWISIQIYSANGLRLPLDPPFAGVAAAYSAIHAHCAMWQNAVYPQVIQTAQDIANFAQAVPGAYESLRSLIETLTAPETKNPSAAVAQVRAQLQQIRMLAAGVETRAAAVSQYVSAFAASCASDAAAIARLTVSYAQATSSENAAEAALLQQIATDEAQLAYWNSEYNKDVVAASTTATYAWIPLVGWIAGATTAGVFGSRAVQAKQQIDQLSSAIAQARAQLGADMFAISTLQSVNAGLTSIQNDLVAVQEPLGRIVGAWHAFDSDLQDIAANTSGEPSQDRFLLDLDLQAAESEWVQLGQDAAGFVARAQPQFFRPVTPVFSHW